MDDYQTRNTLEEIYSFLECIASYSKRRGNGSGLSLWKVYLSNVVIFCTKSSMEKKKKENL
jgi:hypothetical protein